MNEIEQMILAELEKLHNKDTLRGIDVHKEKLLREYTAKKRLEIRHGKLTDQHGREIDLASDLELFTDASYYIARRSDAAEKARFVSRFSRPSKEARQAMRKEMEDVLKKLTKIKKIEAIDKTALERSLDVLAATFLYEITPDGEVQFAKVTDGLVGERRYSFEDLIPAHLIDQERTDLAQKFHEAELKRQALQLFDVPNPKKEYLAEKLALLKKHEVLSSIPAKKLPSIPRSTIELEVIRKECVLRNLDPDLVIKGGGNQLAQMQRVAKNFYDDLDNTSDVQQKLGQIQPAGPATYTEISYE